MPRKRLERSNEFPYHVTGRTNNREPFHLDLAEVWAIVQDECYLLSLLYDVKIHAFTLMPNHFHMLITVPNKDLGDIMRVWMANVTREINARSKRSGHVFGGPYYWSIIKSTHYYGHALKYIYRNPVRANLATSVEDYPFSSLRGLYGFERLGIPLSYTLTGLEVNLPDPDDLFKWLDWLNRPFPIELEPLIKRALFKKEVGKMRDRESRLKYEELERVL